MRLTTRTNLAMRTLMFCAVNRDRTVRKQDVAEACNASQNHLGLVINLLGHERFIDTTRGRNGGIRLNRPPQEICVGDVVRVFEGNVPLVECFPGADNNCPLSTACRLRCVFQTAIEAFYASLDTVTLADLTHDNKGLKALLSLEAA